MPSSHAPIKKYNYERSLFRWVMSRHPEPFEKHGITTRTLERAPLARQAFYTSDWPGARALVQSSDESKYERTPFFDAIIERGLRDGTKFNIEHVTSEEKATLGIAFDRATGKFFLSAYGSPKTGRNTSRRGSQTSQSSSDGDPSDQQQQQQGRDRPHRHPIVKEISDLLAAEIDAAGEHAEVKALTPRVVLDQLTSTSGGCKVIHFSVSIRRCEPTGVGQGQVEGAGAGAGPNAAADAGGGKPFAVSPSAGKRGSPKTGRVPSFSPPALARGANTSPKRFAWRDSSPSKPRGSLQQQQNQQQSKSFSAVSEEGGDCGGGSICRDGNGNSGDCPAGEEKGSIPSGQEGTKRRKSVAQAVFRKADAMIVPKQEPAGSDGTSRPEIRFGRAMPKDSRPVPTAPVPNYGAARRSFLPAGVATFMPALQLPLNSTSSQQLGDPSIPLNNRSWGSYLGTGKGGRVPMQALRGVPGEGLEMRLPASASPPGSTSSWVLKPEYVTTTDPTQVSPSSMSVLSLSHSGRQHHHPTQTLSQAGSSGYVPDTPHPMSEYSELVRQQSQAAAAGCSVSTSDSHRCLSSTSTCTGSSGLGRDPDDDDMDFLAAFF